MSARRLRPFADAGPSTGPQPDPRRRIARLPDADPCRSAPSNCANPALSNGSARSISTIAPFSRSTRARRSSRESRGPRSPGNPCARLIARKSSRAASGKARHSARKSVCTAVGGGKCEPRNMPPISTPITTTLTVSDAISAIRKPRRLRGGVGSGMGFEVWVICASLKFAADQRQ